MVVSIRPSLSLYFVLRWFDRGLKRQHIQFGPSALLSRNNTLSAIIWWRSVTLGARPSLSVYYYSQVFWDGSQVDISWHFNRDGFPKQPLPVFDASHPSPPVAIQDDISITREICCSTTQFSLLEIAGNNILLLLLEIAGIYILKRVFNQGLQSKGFSSSWESSICERKLHYPGFQSQGRYSYI